ncbi:hypothetical protein V2H45_20935 [Tumidithrix elongata RA019]|uniref:Uncharacterized protein n=1 Tax=Tumidithrix elongata BACA0141 TaxID=2716417 RepID=A0AAW9Q6V6_9CYAN|nr:hypothetical protein [Tumidithrix elongata RA019]
MNLNLNDNERSHLGAANLDNFFSHLNFLVDNPEAVETIPSLSTVVYQETGDAWIDAQNDRLAVQALANGENVHRVIAPEKFSLTFPDGRKVIFNTYYLWTSKEVSQLTGLTISQILFLEREKAIVACLEDEYNKNNKYFNFSQIIQFQAYKLILGNEPKRRGFGNSFGKNASLKGADLRKLLSFYADNKLKVEVLQHCPVLFDGQIFSIAPDMSGSQELLSVISSLDWKSHPTHTVKFYPPLFEVFKQLCENALRLTESQVWTQKELEERLMLAA